MTDGCDFNRSDLDDNDEQAGDDIGSENKRPGRYSDPTRSHEPRILPEPLMHIALISDGKLAVASTEAGCESPW